MFNNNSKMGNKYAKIKETDKIGKESECPSCGEIFAKTTLYMTFNSHVDSCLSNPSAAAEKRKNRELEKELE